ncbi:MAG: acetyl-CoA carboxylase carboxyl transferase subunit alpha, partial [Planctomycetes bacterium]|nr:acetyl-CoA carboxylase carboxyl transferase subunit alpha [Planctomycetota bacterium]
MQLTSRKLKQLDLIDSIIQEPLGGAHRNPNEAYNNLERFLIYTMRELQRVRMDYLMDHRYKRWRRMGKFERVSTVPVSAVVD